MASLTEICKAIATTIQNGVETTLFAYDYIPDDTSYPAILVEPDVGGFANTLRVGDDQWEMKVYLLCGSAEQGFAQRQMTGYLDGWGPDSIRRAIYENNGLGLNDGTVAFVSRVSHVGSFESAGTYAVGAEFTITVHTDPRRS